MEAGGAGRLVSAASDAARTVGAGIAIGLGIAWLVSGVFTAVIFGVEPSDLSLYAGVAAAAAVAAFVAAMVPALRATRVDPLVALRLE